MKGVYNKEALNRIASQDRLDRMIVLVNPGVWISIFGAFIIIGGLTLWGFWGHLPTNVDAEGIYLNSGGTGRILSETDGFITDIYVEKGDIVIEDQLLAMVGSEDDMFELRQLDTRIQYVENMTFESEMDVVTTDTEQMAQIKLTAKNNDNDAERTRAEVELKKEKLEDAKNKVNEKEELVLKYKEQFFATLSITDQKTQIEYQEANDDYDTMFAHYESAKSNYISAAETYNTKLADFNAKYENYDPGEHTQEENDAYQAGMEDVNAARMQAEDMKYFMEQEEEKVKSANSALDSARKSYLEYLNEISGTAASNTIASTEYSEALQDYATAKSAYKALSDEIDEMELELVLNEGIAEENEENYEQQFNNQKSAVLSDLHAQREALLNTASKSEIRASVGGEIFDVPVTVGSAVAKGTEVVSILKGDLDKDSIVCYIPVADGKKLKAGMEAYIYPSTVDKQEYGHIEGEVVKVESSAATQTRLKEVLGIDSLVTKVEQMGPVVEVWFSMEEDNTTMSGYHWSTDKGNEVDLTTGTVVGTTTITEQKRPIDILIPYLKRKLDFEETDKTDGTGK